MKKDMKELTEKENEMRQKLHEKDMELCPKDVECEKRVINAMIAGRNGEVRSFNQQMPLSTVGNHAIEFEMGGEVYSLKRKPECSAEKSSDSNCRNSSMKGQQLAIELLTSETTRDDKITAEQLKVRAMVISRVETMCI